MSELATSNRLLVLAPHPDDEVIGAGGLMQRVLARGGEVRVVFITSGESNPWPQRAQKRKWRLSVEDQEAWGERRRGEAKASLQALGVPEEAATFLHFRDGQIAALARKNDPRLTESLRSAILEFQPTLLICPSAQDLHSDHRAVAWYLHQAVRGVGEGAPEIVTYVVHGEGSPSRLHASLRLSDRERLRKRAAIECHQTQLILSRERFLAYARPIEEFFKSEFDLVCTESRTRERAGAFRHSCRVLLGRSSPPRDDEEEPAGDPAMDPDVR